MPFETVGIIHSPIGIGAINTSASTSVTHQFAGPRKVWARTSLSDVVTYDDNNRANCRVVSLVDGGTTKNVNWLGFFGSQVTSITYRLSVKEAWARGSAITKIWA